MFCIQAGVAAVLVEVNGSRACCLIHARYTPYSMPACQLGLGKCLLTDSQDPTTLACWLAQGKHHCYQGTDNPVPRQHSTACSPARPLLFVHNVLDGCEAAGPPALAMHLLQLFIQLLQGQHCVLLAGVRAIEARGPAAGIGLDGALFDVGDTGEEVIRLAPWT